MTFYADRADRHALLRERLADGYSIETVARLTGYSSGYVRRMARQHGGTLKLRQSAGLLYMSDVARILGTGETTVRRWVTAELLHTRLIRMEERTRRVTTRRALITFVSTRTHFPRFDPRSITDPALRAIALQAQNAAGGHFRTMTEIGQALGYSPETIRRWVREGRWLGEVVAYGTYWYGWVPIGTDVRTLMEV